MRLDLPIDSRHRAAIVAVHGERLQVFAREISNGEIAPVVSPFERAPRVSALLYSETLAAFELTEGEVPPARSAEASQPLPTPDTVFTADLARDGISLWSLSNVLDPELEAFRRDGKPPCPSLVEVHRTLVGAGEPVRVLIGLADAVVVGTGDRRLLRVGADGTTRELASGALYTSGYAAAGTIWLGRSDGGVVSGRLSSDGGALTLTETSTLVTRDEVVVLDGDRISGDARDQFALAGRFTVERYDGARWSVDARLEEALGEAEALARTGEGEALVAQDDTLEALRIRRTGARREGLPGSTLLNGLTALRHVPGYGTLAGTNLGEVLRERRGQWQKLEGAYALISVTDLEPYGSDFAYVDDRGVLVRYVEGHGYCPSHIPPVSVESGYWLLETVGEDLVVAGQPSLDGRTPLFWWRPTR